jgi:hypothetical protein
MKFEDKFTLRTEPTYEIDYYDFTQFLKHVYGTDVEIYDVNNDTVIDCNTDLKYFEENEEKSVREHIKSGNLSPFGVEQSVKLLFKDGHIPAGTYLIDVSW